MLPYMEEIWGNPSSLYGAGQKAAEALQSARERIAACIGAAAEEIYFTSGGSESNNMALLGAANARRGRHIVTTAVEHSSVSGPLQWLESQGWEVTSIPPGPNGELDAGRILGAVRPDTAFISMMMVNNETGAVFPVEEIARKGKRAFPRLLIHCDGVQAFGKLPLRLSHTEIDLFSASGHKIQGPKGSGLLYIRQGLHIAPFIRGGGQEKGMRSGTENVPGIAGMAKAVEEIFVDFESKINYLYGIKERFVKGVSAIDGIRFNGPAGREGAPHVVSVSIQGVRSEVMLHALEDKGIYVSAGSACSSNKPSVSATLKAIGVEKQYLDSTLRFSFSLYTTEAEIDAAVGAVRELAAK